jgi:hypothetical protein
MVEIKPIFKTVLKRTYTHFCGVPCWSRRCGHSVILDLKLTNRDIHQNIKDGSGLRQTKRIE